MPAKGCKQAVQIPVRLSPFLLHRSQKPCERRALVHEKPNVALRLGQCQRPRERHLGRVEIAMRLVGERLEQQDFDHIADPAPSLRRREQPPEQAQCIVKVAIGALLAIAGDQEPGKGHVLELAPIAQVVCGREAMLCGPGQSGGEAALPDGYPRLDRCDWAHIGDRVSDIQPTGRIQQIEGRLPGSGRLLDAGLGQRPAERPVAQGRPLAPLLARL